MFALPSPLHPAIVHLPIAIAVLAPIFALGALWAIHRGVRAVWAWGVPVALLSILMLSGWAALQTGGAEGERVEKVVGESAVETHEEAAEVFLVATGVVLLLAIPGFAKGRTGTIARGVTAAGTIVLLGVGYNVGHSGGALVYRNGQTGGSANQSADAAAADAVGAGVRSSAGGRSDKDGDDD
jgi:uncharacterized membrane protein